MKVKVFHASGHAEITHLEDQISRWLLDSDAKVAHLSTAMSQVRDGPSGEGWQYLVVTILYEG